MSIRFFEHPQYDDVYRDVHEPLPSAFDVPVPPRFSVWTHQDPSQPVRMRVRRYRLEYWRGEPRYVWTGWAER